MSLTRRLNSDSLRHALDARSSKPKGRPRPIPVHSDRRYRKHCMAGIRTTTSTGGAWLNVSTASGQIPASLTALINPGALALGTYQGSITVQAPGATPSSSTVNITLTVTAAGTQPVDPMVISANNSADYSTTLAQGSLFVIFGSSLGPATLAEISAFPLPNVLAGTSVTVTAGSITLDCPMVYTSAGQVAAILPSNTPVGEAIITVAYDGVTDPNQQSTTRVTVLPSSVGIFTLTSSGLGTGIFTALDGTVITLAKSAQPGQIVYVWATGLGQKSPHSGRCPARQLPPPRISPTCRSLLAVSPLRSSMPGAPVAVLQSIKSPSRCLLRFPSDATFRSQL